MSETDDSLSATLKETIARLKAEDDQRGAAVEDVIAAVAQETEYTETDAREALTQMLKGGEVYPPGDGRVRVTP